MKVLTAHVINYREQLAAWRLQIGILRKSLSLFRNDLRLLLEYPLLRLGRRLDAVLVSASAIFVLEFKIGAKHFEPASCRQVEDYALDLQDFHAACRSVPIIPILIASEAEPQTPIWPLLFHPGANQVFHASAESLASLLQDLLERLPDKLIDVSSWEHAAYKPVPSIIEAATMLYRKHGVADIASARADIGNLTKTTDFIIEACTEAKRYAQHIVIFVTGIPGAGKTLCGLNVVFGADTGAAFLTGNIPLVHVLREALVRDAATSSTLKKVARQKTKSAIQVLTGFIRDNHSRKDAPHEHIIVFDEAQRAWDAAYGKLKFDLPDSEAALFLDIMRRHEDFSVIIALVGNGQEINTGEAGLAAWGAALATRPDWQVFASPDVLSAIEPRQQLTPLNPSRIRLHPDLHLRVPIRSIRYASNAPWVDAVLRGDVETARECLRDGISFFVTRSLSDMRLALRRRARGERRIGLLCSTSAKRLIADGIWPNFPHMDEKAIANWFLNRWPDIRASEALEIPATQFACQGLELDYTGLCWGNDLIWNGNWKVRRFAGDRWVYPLTRDAIDFRTNTYRVLLTRARYETVIWVPRGDDNDRTREPKLFDQTAEFLLRCGAGFLDANEEIVEPHKVNSETLSMFTE